MKEFVFIIFCAVFYLIFENMLFASTITGQVNKNETLSTVIDKDTGAPVSFAKIEIPSKNFSILTDENGRFHLNIQVDKPLILSVKKEGYRPFSITIDKNSINAPLKIGIERNKIGDIIISNEIYHLGDNIFSKDSANCTQFKVQSIGPSYTKMFELKPLRQNENVSIIIGSIIGLDTKKARSMGQNNIEYVYSTPAEVYFNGQKIFEIHLNDDNISIPVPHQLIRNANQLTIKTGRNLFQREYTDYDDIEIMNITLQIHEGYEIAQDR